MIAEREAVAQFSQDDHGHYRQGCHQDCPLLENLVGFASLLPAKTRDPLFRRFRRRGFGLGPRLDVKTGEGAIGGLGRLPAGGLLFGNGGFLLGAF